MNTVSIVQLNTVVEIDILTEIMIGPGYVSNEFNDRDIQLLEKRYNIANRDLDRPKKPNCPHRGASRPKLYFLLLLGLF